MIKFCCMQRINQFGNEFEIFCRAKKKVMLDTKILTMILEVLGYKEHVPQQKVAPKKIGFL